MRISCSYSCTHCLLIANSINFAKQTFPLLLRDPVLCSRTNHFHCHERICSKPQNPFHFPSQPFTCYWASPFHDPEETCSISLSERILCPWANPFHISKWTPSIVLTERFSWLWANPSHAPMQTHPFFLRKHIPYCLVKSFYFPKRTHSMFPSHFQCFWASPFHGLLRIWLAFVRRIVSMLLS